MLATLGEAAFDDEEWLFEIKYDGYRAVSSIQEGEADLYSRNSLSFNETFAPVKDALSRLKHDAILDGEVVVNDAQGVSKFQLLQNYQRSGEGALQYMVFDLLFLDGKDVRHLPLFQRKELLKTLLDEWKSKTVKYSDHIVGKGISFFKLAEQNHLEGIIAKRANSVYQSGVRNRDWLKIKISLEEEAVICGITAPQGSRSHFGSLVLGMYENGELNYIGNCGTGFSEALLRELYQKFSKYFTDRNPFDKKIKLPGSVQWMKPHFVAQVKFTEWTGDGSLRHPVFLGLRNDKKSKEVMRKNAASKPAVAKKAGAKPKSQKASSTKEEVRKVNGKELILTNQQKIYWPKEHITKGGLIAYYDSVAAYMLPYLKNRPQSMNRFPNGINGPSFYQKDVDTATVPEWIQTEKVYSESNKEFIHYLICNDKATLLFMANLGCIEINPWNSVISRPENPDWMVIDLDPEKIAFSEVVKTALVVREVFEELEIESYCKTSGATGLHIYIPLAGKYDYDIVKTFAEVIAQTVFSRLPDITSIVRSPAKRQKRVYVDFLQNRRGQTLAAPYSVRPKPGATVSTPLEWSEVNYKLDPSNFTIKNTLKRLEKKGDLWKPVLGKGVNIDKVIRRIASKK
ncbi:MAG: DNA ligase D [Chitinophagales bacterium]